MPGLTRSTSTLTIDDHHTGDDGDDVGGAVDTMAMLPDYPTDSEGEDLEDSMTINSTNVGDVVRAANNDVVEIVSSQEAITEPIPTSAAHVPCAGALVLAEKEHAPVVYAEQGKLAHKARLEKGKAKKKGKKTGTKKGVIKRPAAGIMICKRPAAAASRVLQETAGNFHVTYKFERRCCFYQIRTRTGACMQVTEKRCLGRLAVAKEVAELLARLLDMQVPVDEVRTFRSALLDEGKGHVMGHTFTMEGLAATAGS